MQNKDVVVECSDNTKSKGFHEREGCQEDEVEGVAVTFPVEKT